MELLLCLSQEQNPIPYTFKMTNIKVYSIEEAQYHCYHYWKQSYDEFLSEEFLTWVRDDLEQPYLTSQIMNIFSISGIGERLVAFFSLTEYLTPEHSENIRKITTAWEERLEWERLKEQADYLIQKGDAAKACMFYRKALIYGENVMILNNFAIALMKLSFFDEACFYLNKALAIDNSKIQLHLNLAEAAIYAKQFELAINTLKLVRKLEPNHPDIYYLLGELSAEQDKPRRALEYFKQALTIAQDPIIRYRLVDMYMKLRQHEKALEVLNQATEEDKLFLIKQAEVHALCDNVPAAVKSLERAAIYHSDDVEIWTQLAMYHRQNYDLTRAQAALLKALTLSPENEKALLEQARIKKTQGNTREYQHSIHSVLMGLKQKYRDTYGS